MNKKLENYVNKIVVKLWKENFPISEGKRIYKEYVENEKRKV